MVEDKRKGYVYVLDNPGAPGIVKVGRTRKDPRRRLAQHNATLFGEKVPKFEIVRCYLVPNGAAAEDAIKRALSHWRISKTRAEVFRTDSSLVIEVIEMLGFGACRVEEFDRDSPATPPAVKDAIVWKAAPDLAEVPRRLSGPLDAWLSRNYEAVRLLFSKSDAACNRIATLYAGGNTKIMPTANGVRQAWYRVSRHVERERRRVRMEEAG